MNLKETKKFACQIRKDVVTMIHQGGEGHPGPALSVADIMAVLYNDFLNIDPQNPKWKERDRFILSKGHACPVLYAALTRKGFLSEDEFPTLRHYGSRLQGHPDIKTPGVDMTSGSLGNGISIGLGMTLAARMQGIDNYVYVVTGDGELNEGVLWEAVNAASKYKADKLIAFVDNNGMQSGGSVAEVGNMVNIDGRFKSFGWHVQEIDGHDLEAINEAIKNAQNEKGVPSVIIAHTVKGKGVPFMEHNNAWHKGTPDAEQLKEALQALDNGLEASL
jgi:transketolase